MIVYILLYEFTNQRPSAVDVTKSESFAMKHMRDIIRFHLSATSEDADIDKAIAEFAENKTIQLPDVKVSLLTEEVHSDYADEY